MLHGHTLRSYYVVLICSNLISAPETSLNPVEFGWNLVDSELMPNKCFVTLPEIYTGTCGCKKKFIERYQWSKFGVPCTEFCATEKNVAPKFTNNFSWTLHKICKYKCFLRAKFPCIWTESKDTYTRKICGSKSASAYHFWYEQGFFVKFIAYNYSLFFILVSIDVKREINIRIEI